MGGKNKKNKKQERKPLREYRPKAHFTDKIAEKKYSQNVINDILNERVALSVSPIPPNIANHLCDDCGSPKRYIVEKVMPLNHDDYKIVACVGKKCHTLITIYLNERKHGNTPIRPDQVAKGITKYNAPCCGVEINLSHKTIEQVREACHSDCVTRKAGK